MMMNNPLFSKKNVIYRFPFWGFSTIPILFQMP